MVRSLDTRIRRSSREGRIALLSALCLILASIFLTVGLSAQTVLDGNQTIEANIDTNAKGLAEAFPATATATGQVGSINFFLDASSTATKVYVGIYGDSSGKPGTLLTQGSTTTLAPGTWNTATVSAASLTSGTAYWIAILGTTAGVPYFRDRSTTACHSQTSSQTTLTSLPSTWSTGTTWNTCYISAYAVSATLPATVMLGNQAIETYLDKNPAGRAEGFPVTANTTGSVGSIALYLDATSGSGPVYVGLYTDNSGHPKTLLGQGSTTSPSAGNWNQIPITASSVTAGQKYWIAVLGTQATSPYFRDRQTTLCKSETTSQTNLTSLPTTWSSGSTWSTCYISAYGLPGTSSPVLSISPSTLSFSAIQGGTSPAAANLSVANTGSGTLTFTDTTDQPWLSATPTSGTAPKTLQVAAALGTLTAGTYTGHVTVTAPGAQNSPAVSTVTFTVAPFFPPTITAAASPLPNANGWNNSTVTVTFTCVAGSYPIQTCPAPIQVTADGATQNTCGSAVDTHGSASTPACVSVSLDKTPPTITATVTPAPVGGINYGSATVTFTCSDALSGVVTCPSPVTDTTIGANQIISGTVNDKAGNSKSTSVTLNIQAVVPPSVVATPTPAPNAAGWNNTNVTVNFVCTAGTFPIASCPATVQVATEGAHQSNCFHAVDTQGNSSAPACYNVSIDKTPPVIVPSLTPGPNANGWETSPVTVSFSCTDTLSGIASCPSPSTVSTDGANHQVPGTATDVAGNTASASATVNLEQALPTISASVAPSPNGAGWNNTSVKVTFNCNQSVSTIVSCTPQQTVSSQGVGQLVAGTVLDQAGNQASTSVTLNIDETPPLIVQFTAPSQLSPGQSGAATVTVSDIAPIASVSFQLNGAAIGNVIAPPYTVTVTAPSTATSGSTLTLTVTVTDVAGNVSSSNQGIQVASAGVLVGQVLSDVTGLPLAGTTLQVVGQPSQTDTSDAKGRYSIPVTSSQLFLSISEPSTSGSVPTMVTVERQVSPQSGVGTVPVDVRMTPVAAPTTITASGGTVGTGAIAVTVPAGGATTSYYVTPLSQQGLPGLLPLGWSPVAAFDLQTNIPTSASLSAAFTGLPSGTLYLASYSYSVHTWTMVTPNLSASSGALTVPLPSTGDYALVVPDAGSTNIQIPPAGQPLTGIPVVALPTNATSSGSLSPANIAPTGGTSTATLAVQSPTSLPSGTVIQAEVTEKYTLTNGQLVSDAARFEDILLYQTPAPTSRSAVGASFPVSPSQTFQPAQLASGKVHLDILSGRESVRGQTGGSDAVSVQSGDATLTVSAGSLPQDTAISVDPEDVDTFLPSTSAFAPVSEYNVDFSGETLTNGAQLSVGTAGLAPGTNVVIAQIQRVGGVPFLVVVGLAQVTATNIISQATPGFPGITEEGDYVFYELNVPTGFVSGTVSASSGPVAAMVQTDALPFVAFSSSNGNYEAVAAAGTVNLTASVPGTALTGTAVAQVNSGQTATANLNLIGQVEAATITPANGAVGIPLTAEIDITAADAFNPTSVTSSNVTLVAVGTTTPIAVRFVYSAGNTRLAVFPQAALQPSTQYTFQASGLTSALGGLISVPTITFTTVSNTPPAYNTNALVFGMPDPSGNVSITAAAGSFPAGSTILIVDQTNGVVYSLTVFNDGSVSGSMPATINDVLQVTIADPSGTKTTFTVSQFIAADGTTAVGPGGGTVTGPGGTGIIIPQGALTQGVTFKLTQLDQTSFPVLPTWTGANFGSGLRITDPAMPTFKREAKLVFPVPAGTSSDAFYYVYRRLTDSNGNTYFETIDHAFVQGTGADARVVTASPPFCGYHNSYAGFKIQAGSPPLPITLQDQDYFVMWEATSQTGHAGMASQGLIVGLAQQVVPAVIGVSEATTQPAQGVVTITLDSDPNKTTIYDGTCATFTIFDAQIGGGLRNVTASNGPSVFHATVAEVAGAQSDDGLYAIYAGLEDLYKNIGRLNFLFPAPVIPPPPPAITIDLYTLNQSGHRVATGGIQQTGTNLVIAFQSALKVQSASIGDDQLSVETPDATDGDNTDGLPEQLLQSARVKGPYPLGAPGNYTLTVTAEDPISLTQVTASQNILVVAAGGGNTGTFTCTTAPPPADPTAGCSLPQVVGVSPANNSSGVSTDVFPEITFNEPVTNVPGNVVMMDASKNVVQIVLVGVRAPNTYTASQGPIANPVQASDIITSLTIEPVEGLEFNQTYTLMLDSGASCANSNGNPDPQKPGSKLILDLNQAPTGPFCLQPFPTPGPPYQFTTFGPDELGSTNSQYGVLTRPVVIGSTAYAGEFLSVSLSGLGMFDVTDPTKPVDLGPGTSFVGRAIDTAGQEKSPVTGSGLVAISAGTAVNNLIPGNVWLYDVSSPTSPKRVGAVSVSNDATRGTALRLFMKDQYLYASTFLQGLQVIDLGVAVAEYSQVYNSNPTQFANAVSTAGNGFAMDAITNDIQLPLSTGAKATMYDLKADEFSSNSGSNTLIVATGQLPFLVADPNLPGLSAVVYPPNVNNSFATNPVQPLMMTSADGTTNYLLCFGQALDVGELTIGSNGASTTEHIAVVVGNAVVGPKSSTTSCPFTNQQPPESMEPVLAVVDIDQTYTQGIPFNPKLVGVLPLDTPGTDVVLHGTTALVATGSNVLLVNLQDPTQPTLAGEISGNFGNWITISADGLIVGSSNIGTGGIQLLSTDVIPILTASPVSVDDMTGATAEDVDLDYRIDGSLADVGQATITITDDLGNSLYTTNVPVQASGHAVWPAGQVTGTPPTPVSMAVYVVNPDGSTSAPASVTAAGSLATVQNPILTSVAPARIVVGSGDTQVTLIGLNFVGVSTAVLGLDSGSPVTLKTQFTSSTEMTATIPASNLSTVGTLQLTVETGTLTSNSLPVQVVPPGLPPAPVLSSLDITQVQAAEYALDLVVTLTGANFVNGDSLVKSNFGSLPLAAQIISPSQIKVTVPGGWLITPDVLEIHVESSQDVTLASQSLALPILDANGLDYDVNSLQPPTISSVAAGDMVPLVQPNQTAQITVTGSGFQSGAQVWAQVDGGDPAPLQTITVTSGQATAAIDPTVWGDHSYTATMSLFSKNGSKKKQKSVAPISKEQVAFERADKKNICDGYHDVKMDNFNPKFILRSQMVKQGQNHSVLAHTPKGLVQAGGVTFSVLGTSNGGNVSLSTAAPTVSDQSIQVSGVATNGPMPGTFQQIVDSSGGPGLAPPVRVQANLAGKLVGLLNVDVFPQRTVTVALHVVSDTNGKLVPDSVPSTPEIQSYLNQLFGDQANLQFNVIPPLTVPEAVHYDLNNDGMLTNPKANIGEPLTSADLKEAATIHTNLMSKNSSVLVDIYFVHKLQQNGNVFESKNTKVGGFTQDGGTLPDMNNPTTALSRAAVFIADDYPKIKTHIVAHELGHALGFTFHVQNDSSYQSGDRSGTNAATNLMYIPTDENADLNSTCHLNVWQWRRLDFQYPK